ncbi:molybdopterin-binding protein [Frigidibacter sp. RF13]|uniref:molybdopterin-binding protein n=1 Tax=Frigidibacter sp. RF13 TaxID=2997340 RepID=UPI002271AAA7|nr:molybdopterin-binding protein [Frigidibacter sp. RF13]MCY1125992.1 molybdopterin-binding protein [Frigidibacter sp. RF13]
MKFGPRPVEATLGAILAHSMKLGDRKLAKGTLIEAEQISELRAHGIQTVTVAQLEPGDVGEDEAASRLAAALVPAPAEVGLRLTQPHAGRVNLVADRPGIVALDEAGLHTLNRTDPAITLATLPNHARVAPGTLVGTVKIISYAVAGPVLEVAAESARAAIRVRPVVLRSAALILTRAPGDDPKLAAKGREAVRKRLTALGIDLSGAVEVPHEERALSEAISACDAALILILTGAATSDLHDTAPQALRRAGGHVARFGMPVDPGNLLFHGTLRGRPVIGLPGCARSPALNGADWVLERLACGLAVTDEDIATMGVGGLLKEIPTRPLPRDRGAARGG